MKKLVYISLVISLLACSKEEITSSPYPCLDGDCDTLFYIDPVVSPGVYQDDNGYWHIQHWGYQYFTIKGELDEIHPDYIINGTPLVETIFDSNYWLWIDGLTFTVPLYSVLSFFTSGDYLNPIPVGNLTYTIENMTELHPPLNIVGYEVSKHQCLDCPYTPELLGTRSKYTTFPQQQIFFDNQMVGDTATIFIKTIFNTDIGPKAEIEKQLNIIFD